MASISATLFPSLSLQNSSFSKTPNLCSFSLPSNFLKLKGPKFSHSPIAFAAPDVLDSPETLDSPDSDTFGVEGAEIPASAPLSISADTEKMAPKQKIRIKLRSYWVPLIEDSCKQIMEAARTTNAKTMGPVPLPTKKRIYCVLKSPHVNKDARFHFEIRTHQRLIDILYPTAQTIDSLMQLDLPAGVDVEVKL
ncbi:Ribosomal protein S10 domain [Dillenia turbinata]|uniref:Small ribosomal subunit protein uS10c n=1 Tax=Dillenia turbinata TaxID=194707 RepID=A0AAN8W6H1_9MAGN